MTNIEKALSVASLAHANQTYGIYPYMYHLNSVLEVAREFFEDEDILVSCVLHDILEDTNLSYNDIKDNFGINVAEIVYGVTDELGRNRNERKSKTYPKIKSDMRFLSVKLCDRIANVLHSKKYNSRLYKLYKKEHESFKKELYISNEVLEPLWDKLDKLLVL